MKTTSGMPASIEVRDTVNKRMLGKCHERHRTLACKKNKLYNKKGQMEMIGLVVIVILIAVAMLFFAVFSFNDEPIKKVFTREGLAYSSMSAIMRTSVDCNAVTPLSLGEDILEDCAAHAQPVPSIHFCNNQHSCDYFRDQTEFLLQQSLGQWNKRYEFRSTVISPFTQEPRDVIEPILSERGGCPVTVGNRDTSGLFPLQSEQVGLIESVLYVCD